MGGSCGVGERNRIGSEIRNGGKKKMTGSVPSGY